MFIRCLPVRCAQRTMVAACKKVWTRMVLQQACLRAPSEQDRTRHRFMSYLLEHRLKDPKFRSPTAKADTSAVLVLINKVWSVEEAYHARIAKIKLEMQELPHGACPSGVLACSFLPR